MEVEVIRRGDARALKRRETRRILKISIPEIQKWERWVTMSVRSEFGREFIVIGSIVIMLKPRTIRLRAREGRSLKMK